MTPKYAVWPTRGGMDYVLAHFKAETGTGKDIPCFQASAFTKVDKATMADMKSLLKAVIAAAEWADEVTMGLSDHYKAQHNFRQANYIARRDGTVFIPITKEISTNGIAVSKDRKTVITPFVWFRTGKTNVDWGWFESGIKTAINLMESG